LGRVKRLIEDEKVSYFDGESILRIFEIGKKLQFAQPGILSKSIPDSGRLLHMNNRRFKKTDDFFNRRCGIHENFAISIYLEDFLPKFVLLGT